MCSYYELVKNHFAFLQKYGYTYSRGSDENSVSFAGENNRIDIIFSTVGYELTCQFADDAQNTFILQDVLDFMEIKEVKGSYQIPRKEEIETGIIYLANATKNLFKKFDISDAENFQKIVEYRFSIHTQLLEDYYCKIDVQRAEKYWKNGEFSKSQELYEKHINNLSKVQKKKLEYIRKNHKGKCI